MKKIKNKEALDAWLFEHAVELGHLTLSKKNSEGINIYWKDVQTGEIFEIQYEDEGENEIRMLSR